MSGQTEGAPDTLRVGVAHDLQPLLAAGYLVAATGVIAMAIAIAGVSLPATAPVWSRPLPLDGAAAMALLGTAFVLIARARTFAAIVCAAPPAAVSTLVLLDWAMDLDLQLLGPIGRLLTAPDAPEWQAVPSPLGAFGVLLASILCMRLAGVGRAYIPRAVAAVLGAVLVAVGVVPLIGYATSIPIVAFPGTRPMAQMTAVLLGILGAATVMSAWRGDAQLAPGSAPRWLPAAAAVVLMSATTIISRGVAASHDAARARAADLAYSPVEQQFVAALQTRIRPFIRMARREEADPAPAAQWHQDALAMLRDFPGQTNIAWMEPDFRVRWHVTRPNEPGLSEAQLTAAPVAGVALTAAANGRESVMASGLEFADGGAGVALVAPMYAGGAPSGFIVAAFRIEQLASSVIVPLAPGYVIEILNEGRVLVRRGDAPAGPPAKSGVFTLLGREWQVRVWPGPELAAASDSQMPELVLLFGLAVSALGAGAVAAAQRANRDARAVEATNLQLRDEIATRARTETELRLFRALIDRSSDAILVVDPDTGAFLDCNEQATIELGYSREEMLRLKVVDINPTLTSAGFAKTINELKRTSVLTGYRTYARKDGSLVPIEIRLRYVELDRPYVVSVARNIAERQRDEAERARLGTVVEQSTNGIIIADGEGRIQYVNRAFEQIMGYDKDEVIGATPLMFNSGRQDAAFYLKVKAALDGGRTWHGEIVNRRKDGREVQVDASIFPLRDPNGANAGFVEVQRDITREKTLEASLQQAQKLEAVGQLAAGVAHDFNNLLTVVLAESAFTLSTLGDDPERRAVRESILQIQTAGARAAGLTRQLLSFSRKHAVERRLFSLNEMVIDVEPMLRRLIRENIALTIDVTSEACPVFADRGQIEQVILNLVVNAADAMPDGGSLALATRREVIADTDDRGPTSPAPGTYAVVTVRDTGTGMTDEVKEHMFEPFFTTKGVGRGTGLGLATSYSIVQQSGGHMAVQSEPDVGTEISVFLPIDATVAAAETPETAATPVGGTETVLLVEDDAPVRSVARKMLLGLGYTVVESANGREALSILELDKEGIQLLMTDVVMPEMGGRELADRAREIAPNLPVLFVSGYTDDLGLATWAGGDSLLLPKPFTRAGLARKLRDVLDASGTGEPAS